MTRTFTLSYEFFPPKTSQGQEQLVNTALQLSKTNPQFFSVTYGAGGSTHEGTLQMVQLLKTNTSVNIAPHLSCMGNKTESLIEIIEFYKNLGMRHLIALRGDLPSGMGQQSELHYAVELVKLIRDTTKDYFHIEVAAYPECHPEAKSFDHDLQMLKAKMDAGAQGAITQFFFNIDAYFYFLEACAKRNITFPITPGIMPVLQFSKLQQFADRCGADIPLWMKKQFEPYLQDPHAMRELGLDIVTRLCEELIKAKAPGLHFYTLNQADLSLEIVKRLTEKKLILQKLTI